MFTFLGQLSNFGSLPNTMGGNFPSVRPSVHQKVSSISMKFVIHVLLDERCTTVWPWPGFKVKVRSPWQSENRPFWTIFQTLSPPPFIIGTGKWPRILKLGGHCLKFNRSDFWNSSSFSVTWPLNFGPVTFSTLCDLYQTWYTGSTRWEMHNGMTLTRI